MESATVFEDDRFPATRGAIKVIYPTGEDTLWSLSERYHTTRRALAEANRLVCTDNAEAALATSLDGVSYLLLE